ncbi:MAG: homoserine dehydrogenase, partial [Candidatus Aminicenantes bacterium]|nr:homoserine dehydrogenase [Candidatus Aminicenantes bacterium]
MEYKLGLIGCGTVGQGFLEILLQKEKLLKEEFDFEAKIVAVSDKLKGSLLLPEGVDIVKLLSLLEQGENIGAYLEGKSNEAEKMDALQVIEQCDADIIAELTYTDIQTAEPATSHVKKALQTGKHIVTSNKGPAALFYNELKTLAEENNRLFKIEGTVMSGTPVFNLCENAFAGNEIKEIKGILNGTTNFILSKMEEEGMDYEDALQLAQKLGYAEADPTADVEGYDALAKIVILSNVLLGGNIKPSDAAREGITALSKDKILEAKKEGFRYKLIASTRK